MNNLELLKNKLNIKPTIKEREKIIVKLKNNEPTANEPTEKEDKPRLSTMIVDKTMDGFDRANIMQRLAESKQIKVSVRPTLTKIPEQETIVAPTVLKRKKKLIIREPIILEDEDDIVQNNEKLIAENVINNVEENVVEENVVEENPVINNVEEKEPITIKAPKTRTRKTQVIEKGVAVLGPEVMIDMGDTDIIKRLPKKNPPINVKVPNYIMNNREIFVNFINSIFEPYKREMENNSENISCDNIGKTSTSFSLLTHQKIVRDYLNLYTPYRGLLLYHGLGSGKTCTSIAIAEGMKDAKHVIIMTPASLRANYIGELKKCGDLLYKQNQYWEWISTEEHPETMETMSAVLNLPQEYIKKQRGAFFVNATKPSNYDNLSDTNKQLLDQQLNEMISQKYQFVNYNGLRERRLREMTSNYTKNIFDNKVIIIDEAHNFISRIVNKLKKEKPIHETKRGEKERLPTNLSTKLYEMLLSATNARIILLSGTPVINYPNEFAILFNILRGYIKTWRIPLVIQTTKKVDKQYLQEILMLEKTLDYMDYSPTSKILTITRNPFGFKNSIKSESGYKGVSNAKKNPNGDITIETEFMSDDDFERRIISLLRRNDIDIVPDGLEIKYQKSLPDKLDEFIIRYVNEGDRTLKNTDALKRRILGLSSYFKSAQESLLPKYDKLLGVDYHIVRIPMSDIQFKEYEKVRIEERKVEKKKPKAGVAGDYDEKSSTYRIFSRLACNFVIPDRPLPIRPKKTEDGEEETGIMTAIKDGNNVEAAQDVEDAREGEIEGDEILDNLGGTSYIQRLQNKIIEMEEHANDYFTPEALQNYSPKFLHVLENIQDPEYSGLHLVYSQFRTAEGIGLFTKVLNKNGFTQFKIIKNNMGNWEIDIPEEERGKPTYALYTGTETVEEKEIVRKIYNGEWDDIPDSIGSVLKRQYRNNNMGEAIKIFMITSSGSEGINLRNTRYVHLMDPYWHPVRFEQVIGRARRICSHKDLPLALQTVEVFVYLMIFTEEQLKSDESVELKRKDLSKAIPRVPITSDQYLFEISEYKAKLTNQLTEAIKESAFDCYLYSNGKCVNFGNPTTDKFSYVPDFAEQQNDTTMMANKKMIEWTGKPITINGTEYVYRRISSTLLNIYDKKSYESALTDSSIIPVQIGTLEKNEQGNNVFKALLS